MAETTTHKAWASGLTVLAIVAGRYLVETTALAPEDFATVAEGIRVLLEVGLAYAVPWAVPNRGKDAA